MPSSLRVDVSIPFVGVWITSKERAIGEVYTHAYCNTGVEQRRSRVTVREVVVQRWVAGEMLETRRRDE